eukprot:Gb_29639 [translate_table: standard]
MVGYPHMRTMVRAIVPVEIRLVAPIWKCCGILSKVKVVATPSVAIGPITTHIHVLVVDNALFGWTVWCIGCATFGVSFVGLGLVGLRIDLWVSVGSHLAFLPIKRILLYIHWFFSFALYFIGIRDSSISLKLLPLVGRIIGDLSGSLLGFNPRSLFVNFFIELVLMAKTMGSPLARPDGSDQFLEVTLRQMFVEFHASPFGLKLRLARVQCLKLYGFRTSGQEMPPMALPLVYISPSLQEGQFLLSPCHWTLEYEQNSCLHLLETRHFEGMHPFISRF